jgi:hypothetical protein
MKIWSSLILSWIWKQYLPPKRYYSHTKVHGVNVFTTAYRWAQSSAKITGSTSLNNIPLISNVHPCVHVFMYIEASLTIWWNIWLPSSGKQSKKPVLHFECNITSLFETNAMESVLHVPSVEWMTNYYSNCAVVEAETLYFPLPVSICFK